MAARSSLALRWWGALLLWALPLLALAAQPGLALSGSVITYVVQPGDSQTSVGARFGMEPRVLAQQNNLSPLAWLRVGQKLEVDNRHIVPAGLDDGILINLPQRMLFRFVTGEPQAAYPIAVGKPSWPTPQGEFLVKSREQDKTWFVPLSIQREMRQQGKEVLERVPAGPENPLGRHWLGLTLPAIGIHGTIAPQSIFDFRSHGCIRLHPDDAAALYEVTDVGDAGRIVYQPVLLFVAPEGRVLLEVHRDIYAQGVNALASARELAEAAGVFDRVDWEQAALVIEARDGLARDVTLAADRETSQHE
jgi:L,D-transpeptidase ErfK/SrfK